MTRHRHKSHPEIVKRLKCDERHLKSVIAMIEAGRPCFNIAQQLHAVEKAVENAKRTLIQGHLDQCLALHGLEPGHPKTMMAAFIVAIRGTVTQAVLLGSAATISHTAVVWGIAIAGLYLFHGVDAETVEPYFQLAAATIIIAIALCMLRRIRFWPCWRMFPRGCGDSS